LLDFAQRLAHVTVLDPACGSGNFLYVALHMLLDLEKEVIAYATARGLSILPHVSPTQLAGLEINAYAQQLAQVAIWIGYLQWMHHNGFKTPDHPVLAPIESVRCMDAILDLSDPKKPKEPEWPEAEFIVGNPPFLGGNKIRAGLGDAYVETLFDVYRGRVPGFADLCCYWFEKAREVVHSKKCVRVGLLATQGIRGGANREVLNRIKDSGDIFFAVSDRNWFLDGAAVHVSMIGFDDGGEKTKVLDGTPVSRINSNLTSAVDVVAAKILSSNVRICFMGASKKASLDISHEQAMEFLRCPNPDGRPNSDVVRPWSNALELLRRSQFLWIIDFGNEMSFEHAAKYESVFEYVNRVVRPERAGRREQRIVECWWRFARPRVDMREAISGLDRFIVTPAVSKHRIFVWMSGIVVPDQQLLVFSRNDDLSLGLLQSRPHEVWSRIQGTQVRERESGFRYTPTTCFETFPLPEPNKKQAAAIAEAARELDELRSRWLNPPEWTKTEVLEFPGSVDGPWARYVVKPDKRGIGTVRWPRVVAKDPDCAASQKSRTLTNLYNERPTWLGLAHRKLDAAVLAAYGLEEGISDEQLVERLLELNLARSR
jgi:type II restriction/modification system DNA methylase subunit YeeA